MENAVGVLCMLLLVYVAGAVGVVCYCGTADRHQSSITPHPYMHSELHKFSEAEWHPNESNQPPFVECVMVLTCGVAYGRLTHPLVQVVAMPATGMGDALSYAVKCMGGHRDGSEFGF